MAQCHKICLFLEHRVTFAMIYVKFNNHKRIISYSLWEGHGEMKISPWKKNKLLPISSEWKDTHISNFPQSKRTLKHMCGAKIMARGSCVRKLFKVFQHVSNVLSLPLTEREQLDREKRDNKRIRK